ncbi:MAG: sulfatase [Myxococcota bacterium]
MRTLFLLWLTASCTPSPPATAPGSLDKPGGAQVLDLRREPASWALAPDDPVVKTDTFDLGLPRAGRTSSGRSQWISALPFDLDEEDGRFAPAGMTVEVDGRALPWLLNVRDREGWRIEDGKLVLFLDGKPGPIRVRYPRLKRLYERLSPSQSKLSPSDFVQYRLTIGQETREGLLITAGSSGTWTLNVPEGAHLVGSVARAPEGSLADSSLEVWATDRGADERLGSVHVDKDFSGINIDLSAFAGRSITLKIKALGEAPGGVFLAHPEIVGSKITTEPRRVLWVGLDTTRRDRLGVYGYERPITPKLDAWSREALVFERAVTPAPRTRPSFRAAFTGRRPLDAVGAPTFLDVLDQRGFATAGIVANVHLTERFGFTHGADTWTLDPRATAAQQTERAWRWLEAHRHQDSALFLHLMDPHTPYNPPEQTRSQFVRSSDPSMPKGVTRNTLKKWTTRGRLTAAHKQYASDLYDAELASLDAALGELLAKVATLPGPTLVIIHSDHGEEFWDHGGFDHNHTLKPELTDAVMILAGPGIEAGRTQTPAALMDLMPTVLRQLGIESPRTDGLDLFGDVPADRALDVAHLMYGTERWAVRTPERTYVYWTGTGEEQTFNQASDPTHSQPIPLSSPARADLQRSLAHAHGLDIGPGWRAKIVMAGEPFQWTLPHPALSAGVFDPERLTEQRANQVWGERPPVRTRDVATVSLSKDKTVLTITPGTVGRGVVWVRFETPVAPGGTIEASGQKGLVRGGPQRSLPGIVELDLREGSVLVPPPDEAARINASGGTLSGVDPATQKVLRDLGYLGEPDPSP